MKSDSIRVLKRLDVSGDGLVRLRFRGSSRIIEAKALEYSYNDAGKISYLLLDRLVHQECDSQFYIEVAGAQRYVLNVSGCYVSQFSQ